jgi:hypothetical protein
MATPPGRLERFRALRAKLDPAGDPADAMVAHYVDVPDAISARIAAELTLAPASSHLVIGGVGSGKTTELLAIKRRIDALNDMSALYVDVSRRHDISKMTPGAVVAQVGLGFAEVLEQAGSRSPYIERARYVAYDAWEHPDSWGDDDPLVLVPGILTPPHKVAENVERARGPLEGLLESVRKATPHIVVTLDGLDRLTDLQAFEQVAYQDVMTLTSLGLGVVLVGPLRVQYGLDRVLLQRFDTFRYQPWIDVSESAGGRGFLVDVLTGRAGEAFDVPAMELLVANSGGVLRDMLSLAQSALVDAYMAGAERVGALEAEEAILAFGRKHLQGLRPNELEVLQRVRKDGTFVQTSEDDLGLLMTRRVLEYRNGNKLRYAVHPTIRELLGSLSG